MDRNFPEELKVKPKIFCMNPQTHFFVALSHPDLDETVAQVHHHKLCVIPAMIEKQNQAIDRDIGGLKSCVMHDSQSQPVDNDQEPDSPGEIERKTEIRKRFKTMCLARDGAYSQINATEELQQWNESKGVSMLWMKYAGGCSMTQSPNDLGASHEIMKKLVADPNYRYDDVLQDPTGEPYRILKEFLLMYLDASSFATYWKFICKSEAFVDKAFSTSNILSAFKKAGIYPRSNEMVLSKNPEFRMLTDDEAEFLLASIQGFSECVDAKGYIHETEFDEQFNGEEHIDTAPAKHGMPLNEMATNRQRAMIDSHPKWIELQEERRELKRVDDAAKATRAAAKTQRKNAREAKRIADIENHVPPAEVRFTSCLTTGCANKTPTKDKKPKGWYKCKGKNCRTWACGLILCVEGCKLHEAGCEKVND